MIAKALVRRAVKETAAAKEIREVTEGRIAITANVADQIDYSAGRSAKELLMSKLEPAIAEVGPVASDRHGPTAELGKRNGPWPFRRSCRLYSMSPTFVPTLILFPVT